MEIIDRMIQYMDKREKEKLFSAYFAIKDNQFGFADSIREQERILARQKAYNNYNPVRHV